jgi:flagellar motor switch protein FliM
VNQLLSQDEVDALLKGLDTGDIEAEPEAQEPQEEMEVFDWTSQERDIKGSMPLLGVVNNRFSQKFKASLSTSLRKVIEVNVGPPEMIKFQDFQRSLPIPTSLHLFKLSPLRGIGIIVIESFLVFNLVEAYFGGKGTGKTKIEGRDFTPIESIIIQKVVHIALMNLMESWEEVHSIKTDFIRSESNPLIVNVIPPEDYLISVKFEIEMNKAMGSVNICIPYSALQPIRHKLAGGYRDEEETRQDPVWTNSVKDLLNKTELEVVVDLGNTNLTVRDLLNLKQGDILILDKSFNQPLTASVEGIPKFGGFVGRSGDRKVFKIEDSIYPGAKNSEGSAAG